MKYIILSILFAISISAVNHSDKKAWNNLYNPKPMPVIKPTEEDLKYIATKLSDPECVIGVFKVPDIKDPWHKIKATGDYPENDQSFRDYFMETKILKMDVIKLLKGETDSVVFTNLNLGSFNENDITTFYPFPGVSWLMVLNKGIINGSPAGWVKDVKDIQKYKWMNPTTVFVSDPYKGNFYIDWNKKYEMPIGLTEATMAFANDIGLIYQEIKGLNKDLPKEEYNAGLIKLSNNLQTENGKTICNMVMKK